MGAPTTVCATARATVFGLDVHSAEPLLLLQGAPGIASGRRLELELVGPDAAEPPWPQSAEIVCDQRERDGAVSFQIEADREAGYLIWGPAYGRHILSADGTSLLCAPVGCAAAAWQRLLVAQVLPFAALLHGLEVLHASAVVHEGRAIALLGPSRAGKTSLALELCRRGASFLADDVLALERAGERLLGHPGTPVAGIDHAEVQRLAHDATAPPDEPEEDPTPGAVPVAAGAPALAGAIATNDRELIVRMTGAGQPAPLGALFLLERRADGPARAAFEPLTDGMPLLAATFNTVLTGPARLRELLEICALAARGRVERVRAGPALDAAGLAEAILERLGGRA
jgi:hypothetical protein